MQLNLPRYKSSKGEKQRVAVAKARANKIAVSLISSVPKVDITQISAIIDTALSSGSIPSLKAASEIANTPDPNPYKEDREKSINRSGYAIVNENNVFKLNDSSNIEPIRMLYMAGVPITEIRTILSSMTPSSVYVTKVGKKIISSALGQKDLLHKTSFRFYSEYFSTYGGKSYLVCDTTNGNDGIFAIVCEQDENNLAYFKCTPKEYPINGTLEIVVDGTKYAIDLNAEIAKQVELQIKSANVPISVSCGTTLTITCDKPFYFISSDVAFKLGIKDELIKAQEQIKEGYTGYSIINSGSYPYNCQVNKPTTSQANSRTIYNNLVNGGLSPSYARKYISGASLYEDLNKDLTSLKETLDNEELTRIKLDNIYSKNNVRIESVSYQLIKRLLELSDNDLEYLLRYREDVIGIDPYATNQECVEGLTATFNSNVVFTDDTVHECQVWKSTQATIRYVEVLYSNYIEKKENELYGEANVIKTTLKDFLDVIDERLLDETVSKNAYFSETSLGMDVACSANLSAVYSISGGLRCLSDLSTQISFSTFDELTSDCKIIEAYLNAAFSVFSSVIGTIKGVISFINSSLTVFSGSGTASLGVGSILQCSLSLDLSLILPPFLSKLSLLIIPIVEMLEAVVDMIISMERSILCPIQTYLDKYVNSKNFSLPCRISFTAPLIPNIDFYFQGYMTALAGLKALCLSCKQDTNWLRKNVAMLPSTINLLVTNSDACKDT